MPAPLPLVAFLALAGATVGSDGPEPLDARCPALSAAERLEIESSDSVSYDVRWYASSYCVTLAAASRRAEDSQRNRTARDSVLERLEQAEVETFAGSWLAHVPEQRIVVAFTRDAESTLRKYTSDPIFEARTRAGPSANALQETQQRIWDQLVRHGARPVMGGVDIMTARVHITVSGDLAAFHDAAARGDVRIPAYVDIWEPPPIPEPSPPLPDTTAGPVKAFPRFRFRSAGPVLAILQFAKVRIEDGCLRAGSGAEARTVVWQNEAALDLRTHGEVRILDRSTGVSIKPGEWFVADGGLHPLGADIDVIDAGRGCPAPYYLLAGFTRLEGREKEIFDEMPHPPADD